MSAYVRIIPEADYEVLRKYIDDEGIILIKEDVAQKLFPDKMDELDDLDLFDYNFGSEADVYLDIISSDQHYAVDHIRRALEEYAEEE